MNLKLTQSPTSSQEKESLPDKTKKKLYKIKVNTLDRINVRRLLIKVKKFVKVLQDT